MAAYPLVVVPAGTFKDSFELNGIAMAFVHNIFIRALNSMLYQAPKLEDKDITDFVAYSIEWASSLHHHHQIEEEIYFPYLQKRMGDESMHENVEQHAAFTVPLLAFETWLRAIQAGTATFDAQEYRKHIESFSPVLMEHLVEEIDTLSAERCRKYLTKEELVELDGMIGKELQKQQVTTFLPFLLCNHDWASHPDAPIGPVPWVPDRLTRYLFFFRYRNLWRFASCDRWGRLKANYGNDSA